MCVFWCFDAAGLLLQYNGTGVGGFFLSDDGGLTFKQSPIPAYTTSTQMTGDGWWNSTGPGPTYPVTWSRRERPGLLFDPVTGNITHLLTGVMTGNLGPTKNWQLSYSIATRIG